jgi:uncharacterized membrane protein/nitrite reductase/ring-hydroxylating ferredoxin subunit
MLKDILQGKPLRHPLHTFLVHFPIGLFALSLVLDIAGWVLPESGWVRAAFYSIAAGIITALIAAVPGFVDYIDIRRDHRSRGIASAHMGLNLLAVALYGVNLGLRNASLDELRVPMGPLFLSIAAIGILSVSGYLGGYLVYDDGVGVGRHRRRTDMPQETIALSAVAARGKGGQSAAQAQFIAVPNAGQMNDQETMRLDIDGQVLVLAKVNGKYYAFQEFCTHRFGPLSEGSFHGDSVQCPWHKSCFDVRTGKVTNGPAKEDLKTFQTEVRDGQVGILIPREPAKSA